MLLSLCRGTMRRADARGVASFTMRLTCTRPLLLSFRQIIKTHVLGLVTLKL